MRWIDIILPEPTNHPELDMHLAKATGLAAKIPAIQETHGLDSVRVLEVMEQAGREIFQGLVTLNPGTFSPTKGASSGETPVLGRPEHDDLVGYHIVADEKWVGMPWTWLHNGVAFLFEKHPVCSSTSGSRLPAGDLNRPWMQRLTRAQFLVGEDGGDTLQETLSQLRPENAGLPELLFVPGHSDRERRKLIYREAELIEAALEHGCRGETLINLDLPVEPVTPSDLIKQGFQYQAIHFAGPTSKPARSSDPDGEFWMNRLIEETTLPEAQELEDAIGLAGEVLGVDPVTSLLDDIVERYENADPVLDPVSVSPGGSATVGGDGRTHVGGNAGGTNLPNTPSRSWLLDDGPVHPEHLERGGALPPLVFSNSYLAMSTLGNRFVRAGASTFIGPVAPLFSRPARRFAGHCYTALGQGWCTGAAVWKAAQECRQELGNEHPAWLSYGVQGYGQLSLQYL
ncbi:MAG: hypothetical protein ABFS42_15610 [Candidatus Krumholzibacteriota bacterium]